jgi:hypothetical protein
MGTYRFFNQKSMQWIPIPNSVAVSTCKYLNIVHPPDRCNGVIANFSPWLQKVIKDSRFKGREIDQFCARTVGYCQDSPNSDPLPNIDLPPQPNSTLVKGTSGAMYLSSSQTVLKSRDTNSSVAQNNNTSSQPQSENIKYVVQLSDIHFDPRYVVGAEADCGDILCCRNDSSTDYSHLKKPCSKWGEYKAGTSAEFLLCIYINIHIDGMRFV